MEELKQELAIKNKEIEDLKKMNQLLNSVGVQASKCIELLTEQLDEYKDIVDTQNSKIKDLEAIIKKDFF